MENKDNYNSMYWIDTAEQQMPNLMPVDDDGNTLNNKQLGSIETPEQICNAVFEAIKIPGSSVLANPDKAIKAIRSAISVIKNPMHAKKKTSAFLTALAVIFNACQPGNFLSRTSVGKETASKYSSVDDFASASSTDLDTIVGAVEAMSSSSPTESTEKKPKYIPFSISMGEIASHGSTWYTDSGKKLIDSIVIAYAKYGMLASFDNIRINISIVPHEDIKRVCINPVTLDTLETDYACTVNPITMLEGISDIIKANTFDIRHSDDARDRMEQLDCLDDSALEFNVYLSDSLSHIHQKELLVHEVKHCLYLYAYVQKVLSMYARGYDANDLKTYIIGMNTTWLAKVGGELNILLDSNEKFDPDVSFLSNFNIVDPMLSYPQLRPYTSR